MAISHLYSVSKQFQTKNILIGNRAGTLTDCECPFPFFLFRNFRFIAPSTFDVKLREPRLQLIREAQAAHSMADRNRLDAGLPVTS